MYQPERGPWYEIKEKPRQIKIGLVGTCCVGKTSIVSFFEEKYMGVDWPEVVVVPEAATLFFGNPKTTNELIAIERENNYQYPHADMLYWHSNQQRTYWRTQWHLFDYGNYLYETYRKRYQLTNPRFILDRVTPICSPVYIEAHGDREHSQLLVDEIAYAYWPTFTHIGLLDPTGITYVQNQIRTETPEERLRIHQAYVVFLERNGIPNTLITGTLEERIAQVEKLLAL